MFGPCFVMYLVAFLVLQASKKKYNLDAKGGLQIESLIILFQLHKATRSQDWFS